MGKKIINFFATEKDIKEVIEQVLLKKNLLFFSSGLFDSPEIRSSLTIEKTDPFVNYLVGDCDISLNVRKISQKKGGEKFSIDQLENPYTVSIRPGGLIENKCLVSGQIGITSVNEFSLQIFNLFLNTIRMKFEKIKSYYVGQEASNLLDKGYRLTANPKSPIIYDLSRS